MTTTNAHTIIIYNFPSIGRCDLWGVRGTLRFGRRKGYVRTCGVPLLVINIKRYKNNLICSVLDVFKTILRMFLRVDRRIISH